FHVAQQLRDEEIADAASDGPHVPSLIDRLERTHRRPGESGRHDMRAADPGVVVHALDADHPVAGELVVAADLTAADKVATRAATEIIVQTDERSVALGYLGLPGAFPTTANVAADVATGPAVGDRGR